MKIQNSGQVLPFCMMLICVVLWILFSNFEISFLNFKKIEHQKKLDAFTLEYSNNYARGLNALAALNEGLSITAHRAYLVATVFTSLSLCASFAVPPCVKAATKLGSKLPGFYKKLSRLGEDLKRQQDQISNWMIKNQCQMQKFALLTFDKVRIYPDMCQVAKSRDLLPFYRPNSQEYDQQIKGIVKCEVKNFDSFENFQASINAQNRFHGGPVDIEVQYISNDRKKIRYENPETKLQASLLTYSIGRSEANQYILYHFSKAKMQWCKDFESLFQSLTGTATKVFQIPAPLVLKKEFFDQKNKSIVLASSDLKSILEQNSTAYPRNIPDEVWGLTETKIEGNDFQKMEFQSYLHPISLQRELWQTISTDILQRWPDLRKVENDIHH